MKILITGGNSSTALKLLKAFKDDNVILADYGDVPSLSSTNYHFKTLGVKNEDTIAHTLLNNCLDESVDAILPLHSFEIEAVAKAEILFNEFNIEVLVPKADDLNQYLNGSKTDDWVVFKNGEAIFMTNDNKSAIAYGNAKQLNGVFYFNGDDENLVLNLITV
ncbi:hypothetical protein EZ428_09010 [Pedobacter frigiditerrae]|uniref:Uncharacterized protein n=1 Tax=Pedobacter frigiditerrae TaxID=2530452 RepID=A0A4R0MX89_9SPHI|nr:hypothetical protein [Pedobacter frigiditerrae]TCC91878.1 hypothetical protein EZ428_09010 [Pedobacter frigiditerrae]